MREKNIFQKLFVSMVAFVMVAAMLAPMTVEAAPVYSKKQLVYLDSKSGIGYASVSIDNIAKGQKIVGVSSSDKKVAKPYAYSNSSSTHNYKNLMYKDDSYNSSSRDGYVSVDLLKTGKATISVKVGKSSKSYKTYKTTLTVKAYENPMKSFTITGINKGKTIAKKFKDVSYNYGTLSKDAKSAKITVKANTDKGWRIKSINFYNRKNDCSRNISFGANGTSSASLSVSTIYKKYGGYVYVNFYNTKTGGSMSCYYSINGK